MNKSLSSSPAVRIGVITFPGTFNDVGAVRVVHLARAEPVSLWHKDAGLRGVDAVIAPGGFSYGDYLCYDVIARFAPVTEEAMAAAKRGMSVLGVCNGFQILAEAHLLPGALLRNANQRFIYVKQRLCVENAQTAWTSRYVDGNKVVVPMKNGGGSFIALPEELDCLREEELVVFCYMGNPNDSARDIAGVRDERGNVVGPMPHPEHIIEPGLGLGSQTGPYTGADGLGVFRPAIDPLLAV